MGQDSESLTQVGLVEALRKIGYTDVTTRRIALWRANDLLPPFDVIGSGRGRSCGRESSAWANGEDVLNQSLQVYQLLKMNNTFGDLYLPLWILGFPVPLGRIREALRKPLEIVSNDIASEVDGRNAIEDVIDDAAYEFTKGIRRANLELFDVPQDTLAAFMNILLNSAYNLSDQPFQDGVEALREWEQEFQRKCSELLCIDSDASPIDGAKVESGGTLFTHAPFVHEYLSVPHLKQVIEKCTDEDLIAVSRDVQVGREIVLEFRRLLLLVMPYFPDEIRLSSEGELSTILSIGKIGVWVDLSLRFSGYGELIEHLLPLILTEIRKHFGDELERECAEVGPQITMVVKTFIEQLGTHSGYSSEPVLRAFGGYEDNPSDTA